MNNKKIIIGLAVLGILLITIYSITQSSEFSEVDSNIEQLVFRDKSVIVKDVIVEHDKCSLRTKFTLYNNEEKPVVAYIKMVGDGIIYAVNFYGLESNETIEGLELRNEEVCIRHQDVNVVVEQILEDIQKEAIEEEKAVREAVG